MSILQFLRANRNVGLWGKHFLLLFLTVLATHRAHAATERYGSLVVTVEEDARGVWGQGYGVYPVVITNNGAEPRAVTVQVPAQSWGGGNQDHLTSVTRTFRVEAGGTVRGELLAPAIPMNGDGAAVSVDGRRQDDAVPLSISSGYHHSGVRGRAGVLLSRDLSVVQRGGLQQGARRHAGSRGELTLQDAKPIAEWRGGWLTYTGLAEVVVSERDLRTMSTETGAALRGYVLAGGRLTVVSTSRWPAVPGWPAAEPVSTLFGVGDGAAATVGLGELRWWHADDLAAADEQSVDRWVKNAVAAAGRGQRRMDAEQADQSFPVIEDQRTPVRGLLALMVAFALIIGPVNILILSLIKRRMWLLWTVPLGSAVFSGAVVAYALLSEGITPTARTASVTLLDQTTREAVTRTLRGYYAPLTPGDGLHFNMDTAVSPQIGENVGYRYQGNGRGRSVDTTVDQHLARGWVAARVPAHLQLTTVERRRERLDFERLDDGGLAVVNGLGVDITSLSARDADGRHWACERLAAGQRVVLKEKAGSEGPQSATEAFANQPLTAFRWKSESLRLEPGMYAGTLLRTPFVEDGLANIGEHRVDAVVVGHWEETR